MSKSIPYCRLHRALNRAKLTPFRKVLALSLGLSVAGFSAFQGSSVRANTADTVVPGQTDLTLPGTYSGGLPGTTSDVVFGPFAYSPAAFSLNSDLSIGTLNDFSATTLTIQNTAGTTSTLTLNGGTNSVSGTAADLLYVATGSTLTIGGGGAGTLNLLLGAVGNLDIAGTATINSVISGTNGLTKTGTGTLTLAGADTYSGTTTVNQGTLTLTGSLANSTTLALGGGTFNYTPTSAGTKTFSGGTTFNAGGSGVGTATGSTLALGTITRNAGGGALFNLSTGGTISATAGTGAALVNSVLPWALTLSTGTAANNTAAGYNFATITSGNVVAYTGATAFTTASAAPPDAAAVNYDWSSTGTAQVGTSRNYNTLRYTGSGVTWNTNSTQTETLNAFINTGTGLVTIGGGSTMNLRPTTTTNELVFGAMTSALTVNGIIINNTAAASVTILGAGTNVVTFGGTNTYTGTTYIDSGTLSISANANLGSISGTIAPVNLSGGTLKTTNTSAITLNHVFTIGSGGGTLNIAGTATASQGSRVIFGTANTLLGSGSLSITGPTGNTLGGTGAAGTTNSGAGALILNAANTYSGNVTLSSGGLIEYGATSALGTAIVTLGNQGEFAADSGLTASNGVIVSGGTNSVLSFNNGAATFSGSVTLNANLTVGLRNWFNYATVESGTISGVISGVGGLTTNSGTATTGNPVLTLSGANTYTGATTVGTNTTLSLTGTLGGGTGGGTAITSNGTFTESSAGVITGASSFTNSAGTATLAGANTYTGATSINAGRINFTTSQSTGLGSFLVADGSTLGLQRINAGTTVTSTGGLTFGTSGTTNLALDLNGLANPSAALGSFSGALTKNGTINVTLANFTGLTTATNIPLLTYASESGAGTFNLATTSAGHTTFSLTDTATALYLNVTAITNTWTGATNNTWDINTTANWSASDHVYLDGDIVLFDDTGANTNPINLAANVSPASVTFNNSSNTYTISSMGGFGIGGATALVKNGTGLVSLFTANTYTGGTTINAGTLAINGSASLGASSGALVLNAGTLETTATFTSTRNVTLGSANSMISPDTGTIYTNSGVFSGSGTLNMNGAGQLTLSGTNTYTGGTNITAGTVSIAADANLGTSASGVTLNGGTLTTTAGITNTHAFTIGSSGGTINVTTNGQYFFNTANTLSGSGPLTLTGGTGTLTANVGNLRVAQTNTYSGNLTAQSGGIFEYGVAGAVGTGATFTVGNQGEVALQGGTAVTLPNSITVSGGTNSVLSFENGNLGIYSGPITLNGNVIIGLRDWYSYATVRSGTISGVISGNGGLTTSPGTATGGNPVLTLTNTETYTGATTIAANTTLQLGSAGTTGSLSTSSAITDNGTLQFSRTNAVVQGVDFSGAAISGTGGITQIGAGPLTLNAANTYSGDTTISGGTNATINITNAAGAGTGRLAAATGATTPVFNLHIDGGGTIAMANSFGGNSGVTATIDVNNNGGAGTNGLIQLNGTGLYGNATLNVTGGNGYNLAIAGFSNNAGSAGTAVLNPTTANLTIGTYTSTTNFAKTLQLDGTSTGNAVTGVISNGTNVVSLTKTNTSTWTLGGANTYTGATTINGGTLLVNGSTVAASTVTVGNAAGTLTGTLGGTGTVGGTVTVNSGSTVSPGPGGAVGNLTTGALTLSSGGTFNSFIASDSSASQLLATTTTASSGSLFSITVPTGATFAGTGEQLTLIPTGFTGTFSNPSFMAGGYLFTADYSVAGAFDVDVTPVPEPATVFGGVLLVGATGWTLLRRRARGRASVV